MTLKQYKHLSGEDQHYLFTSHAVQLGTVQDTDGQYTLFQLYGFYLELYRTGVEGGNYSTVCLFEETDLLTPYLDTIDLGTLYAILGY